MPAPSIARSVTRYSGYRECYVCESMEPCVHTELIIGERSVTTVHLCINCLMTSASPVEMRVQVGDVIPVERKTKRRTINKNATKRERACAEQIGGRTTPASGSGIAKGDARNDDWMIDDKHTTSAEAFPIKRRDVIKACGQASRSGRKAAIRVGFPDLEIAVLGWHDFLELICKS